MIRSAITVSLVEEARGGPFVYWDGLEDAFQKAAALGFDAIEIFAPGPDAVDCKQVHALMRSTGLSVAAVGTGAGMVKHGLSLTDPDRDRRKSAREFIRQMIQFGGALQAPAIIGSMQGKWGGSVDRAQALMWLGESLEELAAYAAKFDVPLIYEPLNRYETNLLRTVEEGVEFLGTLQTQNVRLLADLFHMNIEEADISAAIRHGAELIGHIHFVDSNRRATGLGHLPYDPIVAAIRESGFDGYLSAEAIPLPSSQAAAENTIAVFRKYFGQS